MSGERSVYISLIRILATFLVILIHASSGYLNSNPLQGTDWNLANWINSFARYAVPLFLLVSGALLLPKPVDIVFFYKNRVWRILPPLIFWNLVYTFYNNPHILTTYPIKQLLSTILSNELHGANAHLWYLYMIFGLYLALPFIQKIVLNCSKKQLEIFLIIWLISWFFKNNRMTEYLPEVDLNFFFGYAGYLVLGYYLKTYGMRIKPLYLMLGFIVLGIFTALSTNYLSIQKNGLDAMWYHYIAPNTALMAACIFLLFKNTAWPSPLSPVLTFLDSNSFGIYLSHIVFLNYIHPLLPFPTVFKILAATLITFILSAVFTALLKKIPYGKYVSG